MTTDALPSMLPTGWFQVAWSADVVVGEVAPKHYFGRDLVLFRELDGQVRVLNSHCQHLGASLAHGGCVVEDGIQCPFHGWVWNGDGRNVRIPYESRPNKGRARELRSGGIPCAAAVGGQLLPRVRWTIGSAKPLTTDHAS